MILSDKDFEKHGLLPDTKEYGGIDFRIKEPSVKAKRKPSYKRYSKETNQTIFCIEYDTETNVLSAFTPIYSEADGDWSRCSHGINGLIIKEKSDLEFLLERN